MTSNKSGSPASARPDSAKSAASNDVSVRSLVNLAVLAVFALQLGLLALIIREFSLENAAFFRVTVLAFCGFVIHALLPLRHRMPFFVVLSLAAVWIVFGLRSGSTLVALGLVLIGICHLPVRIGVRLLILCAAAALLAALRAQLIASPIPMAIWPILGSMFMFRLCVYFYDLRTEKAPLSISKTLSYFFLLPNVCFPLFPVVDYKTFRRTYYDEQAAQIYRKGIRWILRGVAHLLIYRLVYYHLAIAPSQVSNAFDLTRFLISNFMLYLRVSGQFHIAIGMLHLFGFNLPETHHLYYLASNFNDFWRRINIYWKDFMVKLFYYPAFFRLRKLGPTTALVLSTILVFVSTWLLHSYQWFWLLGSFPLQWQDGVFWGVLGVLVIVTSLYEVRPGQARTAAAAQSAGGQFLSTALRTGGTFAAICVLWSIWTAESLEEWWGMWQFEETTAFDFRWTIVLVAGVVAGAAHGAAGIPAVVTRLRRLRSWWESEPATLAMLIVVFALGQPFVQSALGWPASSVLPSLRQARLNLNDTRLLERGYYENLLSVDRFNSQLWELYTRRPADAAVNFADTPVVRRTGDFQDIELVPSKEIVFNGATLKTNRWGFRDGEYEQQKPAETYRMALIGSSHALGWGVGNHETFENLVEARLNDSPDRAYRRYEILNFAVGGYGPLQEMAMLERKAFAFQPDAALYIAHLNDPRRAVGHLVSRIKDNVEIPFADLRQLLAAKGVDKSTPDVLVGRRLDQHGLEIVAWTYREIVRECRARGVLPIWIFMPTLDDNTEMKTMQDLESLAQEAGFITVSVADAYLSYPRESIWVARWDRHPNAKGHALVADKLFERLREMDTARRLGIFLKTASSAADQARR
jgi:D-alanyl-lipoteichoic acid acyltransferase DltB (MBOAT superfamily)